MITNILLTKNGYGKGYLPKSGSAILQPVFPTANLAIRRQVIDEVGLFDTACKTGEDLDMCIRIANTKWDIFFESRAMVRHKHRTTFTELLKQWQGYGLQHPYVFKKHTPKCMEVCYPDKKSTLGWSAVRFYKIFGIPLPLHVLIFITPFHILNMLFLSALLAWGIKLSVLSIILSGLWILGWLYTLGRDFYQNSVINKNPRWLIYSFFRYVLNWVYVLSAFWGGIKIGVLYFEATREKTPH